MGANRKLQQEIDRTLKKVTEGIEIFDQIWDKVYDADNAAQKEKFEGDLKKEIKKLQRFRDQIKTWISGTDIKDKADLIEARKRVERQMERFKVCEKEMKTKAFSKEGLGQAAKLDPRDKARNEMRDWINETVDKLGAETETFDAEMEGLATNMKKKGKPPPRQAHLEESIARHKAHITRLEQLLRLLDNEALGVEDMSDIKDSVDDYLDRNQEAFDEFANPDDVYYDLIEQLDSLEAQVPVLAVSHAKGGGKDPKEKERDKEKERQAAAAAAAKQQLGINNKLSTIAEDSSEAQERSTSLGRKPIEIATTVAAAAKPGSATATSAPPGAAAAKEPTTPTGSTQRAVAVQAATVKAEATPLTPGRAQPPPPPSPAASAGRADVASAFSQQGSMDSNLHREDIAGAAGAPAAPAAIPPPAAWAYSSGDAEAFPQLGQAAAAERTAAQQRGGPVALPEPNHNAAQLGGGQAQQKQLFANAVAGRPAEIAAQQQQQEQQQAAGTPTQDGQQPSAALPPPQAAAAASLPQQPPPPPPPHPQGDLLGGRDGRATPAAALGPVASPQETLKLLTACANRSIPQPLDGVWHSVPPRMRPFPGGVPASYPTSKLLAVENPALFEKLDTEALFFAFYYQPGSYQQYLAAKELKRQSWRYHKQHAAWFQRHEEPKTANDEYEQGTYVYFDYNIVHDDQQVGWCYRLKQDFMFKYDALEDELRIDP